MPFNGQGLVYSAIALAILILIFLICREIVCWYFKYNAMVHELAQIRNAALEQVKTQQLTNAALHETNQLLSRLIALPDRSG